MVLAGKFNLIHIWCVTCWPLSINISHMPIHCKHPLFSEWVTYVCIHFFLPEKQILMLFYSRYDYTYCVHQQGWHLEWLWYLIPILMWKSYIWFVELFLVFYHYSTFELFYIIYLSGSTLSEWESIVPLIDFVGNIQKLPIWKLYRVNLDYINILKRRTY